MNNSPETLRLKQILQSSHAADCQSLAHHLAFETELEASVCEGFLRAASAEIRSVVGGGRSTGKIGEDSGHAVH